MESLFRFVATPSPCGYLPSQRWSLEYEYVSTMTPSEYLQRMLEGWRRFGNMLFHPTCPSCTACRPLRIRVRDFRPDRSQRRVRKLNDSFIQLRIGPPAITRAKLALYDRYHAWQSDRKGWPEHAPRNSSAYSDSFVRQPFPVEEWCYYLDDRLVGVGYVDHLPDAPQERTGQELGGLSAIYFFWDPDFQDRSLGTWNVLSMIEQAHQRGVPYVYLGYYVEGCSSMEYKPRFVPNEVREADGVWRPFRD